MDGLVGVSRFRLGRNSEVGCVLWHRLVLVYCLDSALNPDWGGASLGCDLGLFLSGTFLFVVPWKFLKMLEE